MSIKTCILLSISSLFANAATAQTPGTLNPAFGTNGKLYVDTSAFNNNPHYAVAALPSGGFVATGDSFASGVTNVLGVARFSADGSFDTSFNGSGRASVPIGTTSRAEAVAVQSDGKVVVAGYATIGGFSQVAVARFSTDGSLDTSFNGSGAETISFGSNVNASATSVAIAPGGQIVLGGISAVGNDYDLALARLNTNGTVDSSFGTNGLVTTQLSTPQYGITGLSVLPDSRVVAVGDSPGAGVGWPTDSFIAMYHANGSLDPGFGGTGVVQTELGGSAVNFNSVAVDANGRIDAGGAFIQSSASSFDFGVARFNTDGSLDTTFGGGKGFATANFGGLDYANSMALVGNDKIAIGGYTDESGYPWAVAQFNANGTLDTSFNTTGKLTIPMSTAAGSASIQSMALLPSGQLLLGGCAYTTASRFDFAAVDLVVTVPEPSSVVMLCAGLIALLMWKMATRSNYRRRGSIVSN